MLPLITSLYEKFSDPNEYHENILQEILDCLINLKTFKCTFFDLGFVLLYDISEKNFEFGGFTSCNQLIIENARKTILSALHTTKESNNKTTSSYNIGLFTLIAKNFFKNKINESYLVINDVDQFYESNDPRAKYSIKMNFDGFSSKSEYLFPIFLSHSYKYRGKTITKKILHAVVVLASNVKKTSYTIEDLKILSKSINYIIQNNLNLEIGRKYIELINTLSELEPIDKNHLKLSVEDTKIFDALINFYPVLASSKLNKLPHCLLKYASYWSYNDSEKNNIYLIKNKAFEPSENIVRIISKEKTFLNHTDENLGDRAIHPYLECIKKTYKILHDTPNAPFQEAISIYTINKELKARFLQYKIFSEAHHIQDDDILVLIPIIPHTGKEKTEIDEIDKVNIGLLALYFDKITYPYYFNYNFLELISHKIYENYRIWIHIIRREIRRSILNDIRFVLDKEDEFFRRALEKIVASVVFDEGFLFLFDEERNNLILRSTFLSDLTNKFDYINNQRINIIDSYLIIPSNAKSSEKKDIIEFIKELAYAEDKSNKTYSDFAFYWNSDNINNNNEGIYSLMILPICVSNNRPSGIILCINNKTNINYIINHKSNLENNEKRVNKGSYFSKEEQEIASIGSEVIATFVQMLVHYKVSEEMLTKLGHEIPSQTDYIKETSEQIKDIFIKSHKVETSLQRHTLNLFDQLDLADLTIELFTEYSNVKNITFDMIKENCENFDIRKYLSSLIGLLNNQAMKNGTFVEFILNTRHNQKDHIILVHPFIRLAILNLINNAIKYSLPGTNIIVECTNGFLYYYITVRNIGIPIKESDKKRIFENGFRGYEAQRLQFKGSGSGLYLIKKILDAHKGEIKLIKSEEISHRNIFALTQLTSILERKIVKSEKEAYNFVNKNATINKPLMHYFKNWSLNHLEQSVINRFFEFQIHNSKLNDEIEDKELHLNFKKFLYENYLIRKFNNSNNFDIINLKTIARSVSYTEFQIEINKQIFQNITS